MSENRLFREVHKENMDKTLDAAQRGQFDEAGRLLQEGYWHVLKVLSLHYNFKLSGDLKKATQQVISHYKDPNRNLPGHTNPFEEAYHCTIKANDANYQQFLATIPNGANLFKAEVLAAVSGLEMFPPLTSILDNGKYEKSAKKSIYGYRMENQFSSGPKCIGILTATCMMTVILAFIILQIYGDQIQYLFSHRNRLQNYPLTEHQVIASLIILIIWDVVCLRFRTLGTTAFLSATIASITFAVTHSLISAMVLSVGILLFFSAQFWINAVCDKVYYTISALAKALLIIQFMRVEGITYVTAEGKTKATDSVLWGILILVACVLCPLAAWFCMRDKKHRNDRAVFAQVVSLYRKAVRPIAIILIIGAFFIGLI